MRTLISCALGALIPCALAHGQTYTTTIISKGLLRPTGISIHKSGDIYFTELPDYGKFSTRNTVSKRDARGNALGGVRLPEFAVPSSEHRGTGTRVEGGSRFAFLYGYSREFTAEELAELYQGRDAFLAKYGAALEEAVRAGVVLAEEAPEMRQVAEAWAGESLPAG